MERPSLVVVHARPASVRPEGSCAYRVAPPSVRLNQVLPGLLRRRRWRSGWSASVFEMQAGTVARTGAGPRG